jgi:LemA protein
MSSIWLAALVVAVVYAIATYNRLVTLRTRTSEGWSDIQVQMKRRYDLIPNLVETVKAYAGHEKGTLEAVIEARNAAVADTGSPAHQATTENVLGGALRQLFALSESYPDLKANQNFLSLQKDLGETENLIQGARRYYNGAVKELNIAVEQFPSTLVARMTGFDKAEFFELAESEAAAASQPVKVSF